MASVTGKSRKLGVNTPPVLRPIISSRAWISSLGASSSLESYMDVLQARVDSFSKSKRLKQNSSKRTVTVKWPHPSSFVATPHALAEAGFYYNPSPDDIDSVECFLCGKQLGGWEEEDDPYRLHWEKCKTSCAWATVRCGLIVDVDGKGK